MMGFQLTGTKLRTKTKLSIVMIKHGFLPDLFASARFDHCDYKFN